MNAPVPVTALAARLTPLIDIAALARER